MVSASYNNTSLADNTYDKLDFQLEVTSHSSIYHIHVRIVYATEKLNVALEKKIYQSLSNITVIQHL